MSVALESPRVAFESPVFQESTEPTSAGPGLLDRPADNREIRRQRGSSPPQTRPAIADPPEALESRGPVDHGREQSHAAHVPAVLVIDPAGSLPRHTHAALEATGCPVAEAATLAELSRYQPTDVAVVVIDLDAVEGDAIDVLRYIRQCLPEARLITMIDASRRSLGRRALKAGALHYVVHPIDVDELVTHARRAVHALRLARDNRALRAALSLPSLTEHPIGESAAMSETIQQAAMAAPLDSSLLIVGPPGAGKSFLARWVHQLSPRRSRPIVPFGCGAGGVDVLATQLIGCTSLGGKRSERPGALELARGGTLLLEDVDRVPWELQHELYRFLQSGTVCRRGSYARLKPNVRLIATSTRDLSPLAVQGTFHPELAAALGAWRIEVPPLHSRAEDILLLAEQFTCDALAGWPTDAMSPPVPCPTLGAQVATVLRQAPWPGNVRQLSDVIHRALRASGGTALRTADIEAAIVQTNATLSMPVDAPPSPVADQPSLAGMTLAELERRALIDTIRATGGNKAKAARMLQVSEKTIYNKIRQYDLRSEFC